jgi:hypothetical protein
MLMIVRAFEKSGIEFTEGDGIRAAGAAEA